MKACSSYLLVASACLFTAACQPNAHMKAYIDLLNTEQRLIEDDFYAVDSERRYLAAEMKQLQQENDTLRKRLGLSPTDPVITTPAETAPGASSSDSPSRFEPKTPSEPMIEIPDAPRELPNGSRAPAETIPAPDAAAAASAAATDQAAYTPPDDLRVTHLVINPVLTSGHNFDRRPGDDGISVVFEPRNAEDAFVPRAGDISIVVLDPSAEGESQRVARWDFPRDEALHRIRTEQFGRGLNFKLPWPGEPPQHERLYVFVRYTSDDGRVLEDKREIEVAGEGTFSERWTPKSMQPVSEGGGTLSSDSRERIPLELPPPAQGPVPRDVGAESRAGSVLIRTERVDAAQPAPAPEEIPVPKAPAWSPYRP
jgi:hypothetical protein